MVHLISLLQGLHILAKYMTVDTKWTHDNNCLMVYNISRDIAPEDKEKLKQLSWKQWPYTSNWYVQDGEPFKWY